MKFGFNKLTSTAAEKLSQDGVRVVYETATTVAVYTDLYDSVVEDFELRGIERPDVGFSGDLPTYQGDASVDVARMHIAEPTRHWFCKTCDCQKGAICTHPNRYYYLIKDKVYVSILNRWLDYRTTPPTINEETTLDFVDEPGSVRDILLSRPPSVRMPGF